jgi:prevent-host-death family protein
MAEAGAYEAKTRLGELLKQVAKGVRVTITKHGVPVAVLIPAGRSRREVVSETIATMVAEGRR